MKPVLIGSLTLAAALAYVVGVSSQPPPGRGEKRDGFKDGFGGRPPRFQMGVLFPPHVKDGLKLTPDQEKQLAELEASTKAKLEKILTDEQKRQIERPRAAADDPDGGRPVAEIARDLGVTPEQFREAFRKVQPAPAGQEPTAEQRQRNRKVLSEALGVPPEKLDEVMDKYRPAGRGSNGPPRP